MFSHKKSITVFTPTFNRAHTLTRLYRSLCNQTCNDFEWLVIDDGSTDNTKVLINDFISEKLIRIRYIYKENGGLYTGYNTAYENIETELNVCIDSDDFMPDNAVELILNTWKEKGSEKYAGITGLDFYSDTDLPIGGYFPEKMKEVYLLDLYLKNIHRGDSKQIMRTDLMKKFSPLVGFPAEKNFNPIFMILQACDSKPVILLNENLCYVEYQNDDSMSKSIWQQYMDSPRSYAKARLIEMNLSRSTLRNNIRLAIHYVSSCFISRDTNWLRNTRHKLLVILSLPVGYLFYLYICYKNRK